jgi:hypothetical protein
MLPAAAFVLVTGFTMNNERLPQSSFPVSPMRMGHKLALKLNTPKHGCIEYRMAAPYIDMADVIQDAQQDGIIR